MKPKSLSANGRDFVAFKPQSRRPVMTNPFMRAALDEARRAYIAGEIPVGAVIVKDQKIIARAHNLQMANQDALCHAEVLAIQSASRVLNTRYLSDCDLYGTLEPCAMCCGAIAQAKLRRLYFGAYDPKGGFAVSNAALLSHPALMYKAECYCGIMEDECAMLLQEFFSDLRQSDLRKQNQ